MMLKSFIKCLLGVAMFTATTAMAQTAISDKKLHILTLGDSNGSFPHSWPQQLKLALPNADVFNISKSGRTVGFVNNGDSTLNALLIIDQALKQAAEHAGDTPYDFVVIDLGTNDGKAVFADKQNEVPGNYEKLLGKIQGSNYGVINHAKIVIISPTPYGSKAEATDKYANGGARMKALSIAYKKIAKKHHCLFVNGLEIKGLDVDTQTADGLHLDATASRKLIEPVVAAMLSMKK